MVNRTLHDNYHRLFEGPELPMLNSDCFRQTVLAAAGVVPQQAVDVASFGGYRVVDLSSSDYSKLTRPTVTKIDKHRYLGDFIADYAATKNVEDYIDNSLIDEFLDSKTQPDKKISLARFMLGVALDISLEPLDAHYRELKKDGYVRPDIHVTMRHVTKRFVRVNSNSLHHFKATVEQRLLAA